MSTITGIVTGVDRESRVVHADVHGAQVDARYLGDPPWPLSTCLFQQGPSWVCLGPIGDRRRVLVDDFMFLNTNDFNPDLVGDTLWANTNGEVTYATVSDAAGAIRLSMTVGTAKHINKRGSAVALETNRVWHLESRVRLNDPDVQLRVGLGDSNVIDMSAWVPAATDAGVVATLGVDPVFSQQVTLDTFAGTSSTSVTTGETNPEDTWVWVDLMVLGGQWACLWMDGSGPWVSTTYIPDTSYAEVTPFFEGFSTTGTTSADIDYCGLSLVSDVADPTDQDVFGDRTQPE